MRVIDMALSKNIVAALTKQINAEFFSSYLYLSMASQFDVMNLKGFSNWMKVQAQEEITHAMKFFGYLSDRGSKVELLSIDRPKTRWKDPLEVFKGAYDHEVKVTDMINKIVTLALKEGDHNTNTFLQWFVNEQIEEEASTDGVVQKLKLIKSDSSGLFMIDQELAQRVFVPATANQK